MFKFQSGPALLGGSFPEGKGSEGMRDEGRAVGCSLPLATLPAHPQPRARVLGSRCPQLLGTAVIFGPRT